MFRPCALAVTSVRCRSVSRGPDGVVHDTLVVSEGRSLSATPIPYTSDLKWVKYPLSVMAASSYLYLIKLNTIKTNQESKEPGGSGNGILVAFIGTPHLGGDSHQYKSPQVQVV